MKTRCGSPDYRRNSIWANRPADPVPETTCPVCGNPHAHLDMLPEGKQGAWCPKCLKLSVLSPSQSITEGPNAQNFPPAN